MKRLIFLLLILIPTLSFSQATIVKAPDTTTPTILTTYQNNEDELDDEYKERPFRGKEQQKTNDPYAGYTDHERYNIILREMALKEKSEKEKKKKPQPNKK